MPDRLRTALRSLRVQVSLALLVGASLCALAASRSSHDELAGAYAEGARAALRAVADEARADLEGAGPAASAAPAAAARVRALRRRHPLLREARLAARPPGLTGRAPRFGERDDRHGHVATLVTAVGRDGALVLAYDLDRTDAALAARSRRLLLVLSALLLGFTAFTALVLRRAIFGPLARLRVATQDLAGGRLGARLGWGRRDELGVLARDFDAMAAELEGNDGRLRRMAHEDPLTGLANHRRFRERLGAEVAAAAAAGEPLSVVALDIDHFKSINDAGGHPAGDAVLRAVAGVLTTAAGERGLAARLGGDEFALLLPGAGADTARSVARAVCAAVAAARPTGADVSCSAGLAAFPDDAEGAAALVELADGALYWAKRSGRGGVRRYDPEHVTVITDAQRAELVGLLDTPGAIRPVFQPIVDLATGRVAGYEALARFDIGEVRRPPTWWFANAHALGFGPELEAQAIAAALAVTGRPAGAYVSINVSPSALRAPALQRVLPEDLRGVVVEITEHEQVEDAADLRAALAPLRARGARVAVDDTGAGWAGLQQVMELQADVIKLDRALVTGIDRDPSRRALVAAFATYAVATGAELCAEGIEELAELEVLAGLGVSHGQGYGLGRPGTAWPAVEAGAAAVCRRAGPLRRAALRAAA
jgi:diguanylate cyclase (GGDEF)-like protein